MSDPYRWTLRDALAFARLHRVPLWRRIRLAILWLPYRGRNVPL